MNIYYNINLMKNQAHFRKMSKLSIKCIFYPEWEKSAYVTRIAQSVQDYDIHLKNLSYYAILEIKT